MNINTRETHQQSRGTGGGNRLRSWQGATLGLMTLGYAGYYLCRSNFSVALKLIEADLVAGGMAAADARFWLGMIASLGTLAYAAAKVPGGLTADTFGGRRNFLFGMVGAIACTVGFALGGSIPIFSLAWVLNRFLQSFGWLGMMKITSRWFSFSAYGTAVGVLSLSYLFGDAASRWFMGELLAAGLGWRSVFLVAAGVLAGLLVLNALLLRESPTRLGLEEPDANPTNVYGKQGQAPETAGPRGLFGPLLRSPAFWTVCLLSLGLTLLRETFNTWTPTYFAEGVGLSKPDAARTSALFPFFGGVSVILAGVLADRLGRAGRAAIILGGLVLAGAALATLGLADLGGSTRTPVVLIAATGFLLIGPYSYLAGSIALDFGGKRGGATASGLIDAVGYLGGVLSGVGVARLSGQYGWGNAFVALAGIAWLTAIAGLLFLLEQWQAPRRTEAGPA